MFFLIHQPASQGLCSTMALFGGCLKDLLVTWQLLNYAALSPITVRVPIEWDLGSGLYV